MSIENNLERIATALEAIAVSMKGTEANLVLPSPVPEPKPKKAPKAEAPAVPTAPPAAPAAPIMPQPGESVAFAGGVLSNPVAPPVAPPPAPVAPVAPPPAPVVQMTVEQLNTALNEEVQRLGSADGVYKTIRDLQYNGIADMPASMYGELLNRVKAL